MSLHFMISYKRLFKLITNLKNQKYQFNVYQVSIY